MNRSKKVLGIGLGASIVGISMNYGDLIILIAFAILIWGQVTIFKDVLVSGKRMPGGDEREKLLKILAAGIFAGGIGLLSNVGNIILVLLLVISMGSLALMYQATLPPLTNILSNYMADEKVRSKAIRLLAKENRERVKKHGR